MSTIQERVAAGVKFLDRNHPKWINEVDLSRFNIEDECNCVLGQIVSNYDTDKDFCDITYEPDDDWGIDQVKRHAPRGTKSLVMSLDGAQQMGFEANFDRGITSDYEQLQREWKKVIKARQAQK